MAVSPDAATGMYFFYTEHNRGDIFSHYGLSEDPTDQELVDMFLKGYAGFHSGSLPPRGTDEWLREYKEDKSLPYAVVGHYYYSIFRDAKRA